MFFITFFEGPRGKKQSTLDSVICQNIHVRIEWNATSGATNSLAKVSSTAIAITRKCHSIKLALVFRCQWERPLRILQWAHARSTYQVYFGNVHRHSSASNCTTQNDIIIQINWAISLRRAINVAIRPQLPERLFLILRRADSWRQPCDDTKGSVDSAPHSSWYGSRRCKLCL